MFMLMFFLISFYVLPSAPVSWLCLNYRIIFYCGLYSDTKPHFPSSDVTGNCGLNNVRSAKGSTQGEVKEETTQAWDHSVLN